VVCHHVSDKLGCATGEKRLWNTALEQDEWGGCAGPHALRRGGAAVWLLPCMQFFLCTILALSVAELYINHLKASGNYIYHLL
jgi:hypothetical protein